MTDKLTEMTPRIKALIDSLPADGWHKSLVHGNIRRATPDTTKVGMCPILEAGYEKGLPDYLLYYKGKPRNSNFFNVAARLGLSNAEASLVAAAADSFPQKYVNGWAYPFTYDAWCQVRYYMESHFGLADRD